MSSWAGRQEGKGNHMSEEKQQTAGSQGSNGRGKPFYKRVWFWILLIVVIIVVASVNSNGGPSSPSSSVASPSSSSTPTSKTSTPTSKTRDNSTAKAVTLGAGTWTVGSDVQAGRYVIAPVSGLGNLSSTGAKDNMDINEVVDSTGENGVKSWTGDLTSGMKVEIQGVNEMSFTPASTKLSTSVTTGVWTVGVDIPAGSYTATPAESTEIGNFIVYVNGLPLTNEVMDGTGANGVKSVHASLSDGDVVSVSELGGVNLSK